MRDETLLKLSLIISLIGLALLFAFAQAIEAEEVEIADIGKTLIDKNIELFVNIDSFYSSSGNYFLKVSDKTGNLTAVLFKQEASKTDISKLKIGQQVKLSGKVSEYKGNLEVISNKIEFI